MATLCPLKIDLTTCRKILGCCVLTSTSVEGKRYAQHWTRLFIWKEFRTLQIALIFGAQKSNCEKLQCSHKLPYDYNTVIGHCALDATCRYRHTLVIYREHVDEYLGLYKPAIDVAYHIGWCSPSWSEMDGGGFVSLFQPWVRKKPYRVLPSASAAESQSLVCVGFAECWPCR